SADSARALRRLDPIAARTKKISAKTRRLKTIVITRPNGPPCCAILIQSLHIDVKTDRCFLFLIKRCYEGKLSLLARLKADSVTEAPSARPETVSPTMKTFGRQVVWAAVN